LLKNEHIVTIYQAGETSLVPYLVMECLEGVPLDEWLRRQGKRVAPAVAIKVAKDTLRGLNAIHQSQMVHRDIKPANLWVDKDASRVKVLDFGLTRGPTAEDRSTLTGGILGTPAYMAPEQAAGKVADARSDLFSLGIVIYEMLAGANPFARESAVASMNAVAHDVLPSLSLVRKDLPLGLVRLVESMLAKTPADRPESAAKALEAFLSIDLQGKQAPSLEELLPPPSPISKRDSKANLSEKGSGTKLASSNPQFGEKQINRQGEAKQRPVQKGKQIPDWLKGGILTFTVVLVLGLVALLLRKWLG
jgi:serine/threonine protein kinase